MVKSIPVIVPYYLKCTTFMFKGFFKYFHEYVMRFKDSKPTIETI